MGDVVSPAEVPRLCRDPGDDEILAIASAGHASALVTGDVDLLTLANYGQVRIVTVADFEERGFSTSTPEA
ncbi:MAG: putative toxin-antitoxin system toxin component, PIN family [Candidatus Dormibacteria bacterium]